MRTSFRVLLVLLVGAVSPSMTGIAGQDSWDYQLRNEDGWEFSEGAKGAPVSGHQVGIELLAVEAVFDGYQPKQEAGNDTLKVRFCRPESVMNGLDSPGVKLTFKELQDFEHYVLSGATRKDQSQPWGKGCGNIFPWRTQRAKSIVGDLGNIGAVVALDQRTASSETYVVPAFLYQEHHGCPKSLVGYRIVFRSIRSADVVSRILDQAAPEHERLRVESSLKGGMPVSVLWNTTKEQRMPEGWYLLDVQGKNSSVSLRARLFHRNACQE